MKHTVACVALASLLSACGGGGGGPTGQNTQPVSAPFAKYEGDWKDVCQFHHRETVTMTASTSGTSVSMSDRIEYFANEDCSGALVATGVYSQPIAKLQYITTETSATVKLQNGETVTGSVDRGVGVGSDATVSFTGSGVTSSIVNGKTVWHIAYAGGSTDISINSVSGATPGGLFLRNGQLYILTSSAGSTTSYDASGALSR